MYPSTRPLRLLLVDDHAAIREGLTALLSRHDDLSIVAQATNGQEAVELFRRLHPDVTLMDARMPVMNGIQAIETICQEFPSAAILLFTTFLDEETCSRALLAGARACLLKDCGREELFYALRSCRAPLWTEGDALVS